MSALIDYLSNGQITEAKDHLKQFHPETNPIPPQELSALNERGDSVLYLAVLWGDLDLVMSLLSFNIKINDTNEDQVTPLMIAYMLNNAELLIRNGANVYALMNADFNLILDRFEASHYDSFLDDQAMNRENFLDMIKNVSLLLIALKSSSPEITIRILSIIKEIPKDFLIFAAENKDDDPTLVEYLLNQGVDVNAQDNEKKSAIIAAVSAHNNRILAHLLQAGAAINIQDAEGKSALMICVFCNNKIGVKLLLNRHADVNLKNNNNRTALSLAYNRDTEILEMLVNEGADVNVPGPEDEPILYSCA